MKKSSLVQKASGIMAFYYGVALRAYLALEIADIVFVVFGGCAGERRDGCRPDQARRARDRD